MNGFRDFLLRLGYSDSLLSNKLKDKEFTYSIDVKNCDEEIAQSIFEIKYLYTQTENDIFEAHLKYWNRNNTIAFIAVADSKSYIINAKAKPEKNCLSSRKVVISSFDYGVNTKNYEDVDISYISKTYMDSFYFFDFVIKNAKSRLEVDKDLLLNLIALRSDLIDANDIESVHLLILRCIFIKYLEDRGILESNFLLNKLKSRSTSELISAFEELSKINGDLFKDNIVDSNLNSYQIERLEVFFSSDYCSKQILIFPYRFDIIPIQLISSVYEAFLSNEDKRKSGIYYTPDFLVSFVLSNTLKRDIAQNCKYTVLDPACGSGAFLVESFKSILASYPSGIDFHTKTSILEKQIFGIDTDVNALLITAFSLYLVLLESEDPAFIRQKIIDAYPILPSLIDRTLIYRNTLIDEVFENMNFNYIVGNPPWGSADNETEREAIGEKNRAGTIVTYKSVSDYERSQAFLLRVKRWSDSKTTIALIVKNSIFLNINSKDFRFEFLSQYSIERFYELSNYNKILFEKKTIGKINKKTIEIGATEPCAVVIFNVNKKENSDLIYVSPKLNRFSESVRLIVFSEKDKNVIQQNEFRDNDILWRVLVNADYESYQLIQNKLTKIEGFHLSCKTGFQPKADMENKGKPLFRALITPNDFIQYKIINELTKFNWNQKLHRDRAKSGIIFEGNRILIPAMQLNTSDKFQLRGIRLSKDVVFKDDILCFRKTGSEGEFKEYAAILGIINSKIYGFMLYQLSAQWGKEGGAKRPKLRNKDIEKYMKIPEIDLSSPQINRLINLVESIEKNVEDESYFEKLDQIDEIVFDLYGLLDYEKEIIREFYQINVNRKKILSLVNQSDMKEFIKEFSSIFGMFLSKDSNLSASYYISSNIGAIVCFKISNEIEQNEVIADHNLQVLNFVKQGQLEKSQAFKIINEEKVKIYNGQSFYIIKSNQFKDWTKRQAIMDARAEINLILKQLLEK